jgi:hypothetical protein
VLFLNTVKLLCTDYGLVLRISWNPQNCVFISDQDELTFKLSTNVKTYEVEEAKKGKLLKILKYRV